MPARKGWLGWRMQDVYKRQVLRVLLFSFSIFQRARPAEARAATLWSVRACEVAQAFLKTMAPRASVVTSSSQLAITASSVLRKGT